MREDTVLKDILRNYANVNARDQTWMDDIRLVLSRNENKRVQFKTELEAAIEDNALSMKEYERLTGEDFDTHEEYIASLKEFREELFGASSS